MWGNSRVIRQRWYHPLLWPWYIPTALIVLYLLSVSVLFYLYRLEKTNPAKKLYEKNLETRRQELTNIKLSGVESYIWKPILSCTSYQQKRSKKKHNEDCIKTKLAFTQKVPHKNFRHYIYGKNHTVQFSEKTPGPCLICHQKKSQTVITWTFVYPEKRPPHTFTAIWESKDFRYVHAIFWTIMGIYFLLRILYRLTKANDLIAVAIRSAKRDLSKDLLSGKWKKEQRMFLYIEVSENYISGYIPRRYLLKLYKKYFTGSFDFSELDLKIGVVDFNSLSFEGLRIAQVIASKAVGSSAIVQDKILTLPSVNLADSKKAIWKRKNKEMHFNVIEF